MVYYCDICGSPIKSEPVIVEIDGATLILCETCSRKYATAKRIKTLKPQEVNTSRFLTPQPFSIRVQERGRTTTFRIVTRQQPSKIQVRPERFEIVENYAEIVKKARESMGLTRELLARLVGVKESIIRRIEEGQLMPDVELARKLEKILRVKLLVPAQESAPELPVKPPHSPPEELTLGDIVEIRRKDEE